MEIKKFKLIRMVIALATALMGANVAMAAAPNSTEPVIDYAAFLGNHDMVWDRIPTRWEVAPFTGNGKLGLLFYQDETEAANVMSLHVGRSDYHDHRLPDRGMVWVNRGRLPVGHFNLTSKGDITGVDLRLDLWNAELSGTVQTSQGSYKVRGLTHSTTDVFYFETEAEDGEAVAITWHPAAAISPIRTRLAEEDPERDGAHSRAMREAPYPAAPEPILSQADGIAYCHQVLYDHRGETTTGWEVSGKAEGRQVLTASIHHSFPERDSLDRVQANLMHARERLVKGDFISSHQSWWHDYYPLSFLTFNDAEKESFYWIQMYKLASATRANGPVVDNMGPWYQTSHWPLIWNDMNVEVIYLSHLVANRMSIGESLLNSLDRNIHNLEKNVPEHWKESAAIQTACAQDWTAYDNGRPPDLLAWILFDYWLHCEYAADRDRMRDGLFPLLKRVGNGYLNYLRDNPVESDDGKIHFKKSWSPEYPGGWGEEMHGPDVNFTIALCRWTCQMLLDINAEHHLNDPLAVEWQNIVDNLVELQLDADGLRIGKDVAYDIAHRHYSHLLAFYPLAQLDTDNPAERELAQTSVDQWIGLCVAEAERKKSLHGPMNGFAATAASSMYAWLGDGEQALHYLNYLMKNERLSPTTMYAEGNPCIESPLSLASTVHDMLLQSRNGKIRVFHGTPSAWPDVAFQHFRTQGAFLVSAKKKAGITQFVTLESLAGAQCLVHTDIEDPEITINGKKAKRRQVKKAADGFYEITLKKGDSVTFTPMKLKHADLSIEPLPIAEKDRNVFGLNDKTTRLPGHQFYYEK